MDDTTEFNCISFLVGRFGRSVDVAPAVNGPLLPAGHHLVGPRLRSSRLPGRLHKSQDLHQLDRRQSEAAVKFIVLLFVFF